MLGTMNLLLFLFQFAVLSSAQSNFVYYLCDNTYGNYTNNSTYQQNLNTLLSNISSNTQITYGFYNFTSGKDPDRVNGIALCRGDVLLADCRSCLKSATTQLFGLCTNQMQAIGWYDNCMVRYTNRSIFGVMEDSPLYSIGNPNMSPDQSQFIRILSGLLDSLQNKAAAGNSTSKFAFGQANVSTSLPVYAFAQCTPDLSQSDCQSCISESISSVAACCLSYEGARFFRPSCNIRYEVFKFSPVFDTLASATIVDTSSLPPTLAPSSPPNPGKGKGVKTAKIALVAVAVIVACLLLVAFIYLCLRQQRREGRKYKNELGQEDEITSTETLQIAYGDIKEATQDFAEANKLGRGGFGTVYKGVLADGQEIAVKRLATNSAQGEEEFRTEVLLVAKLQHRNLVKLLGFCLKDEERLLVYEFVPNASLDHFLFGKPHHVSLDWQTRYKIIGGIARGLLYLHEDSRLRIVHRDLKAGNILLDAELNPKIADFGMARLFQVDQTHADTERIAGTFGYMAPEYAYRGIFSIKSDVYSFGVLVLEIICGQKNSGIPESDSMATEDLITLVWRNWTEGSALEVVDPALLSASRVEIMRCIQIGLLCVQADPVNRPTMSLVSLMLSSESFSMPVPSQPAYVLERSLAVEAQSQNTVIDESITELHPR